MATALQAAYRSLITKGRLQPNKGQEALVEQLSLLQARLESGQRNNVPINGIYIYGGVGTGKSRLADLFAATLPNTITKRRTHFHEFMTDTHIRLHQHRSRSLFTGDPLTSIGRDIRYESSVLCLDEFQVSDIADAMILKRLFTSFWDEGGTLVSTSNRAPWDLYKNGLNRPLFIPFIEELQRRCLVFEIEGSKDYRMSRSSDAGWRDIFYTSEPEFQKSLSESLDSAKLVPRQIQVVMNRSFNVNAAEVKGKWIVDSSFKELCEASLGAADYHALCRETKYIGLEGLRKFAADEVDVVRRFIVLVDVAYESRTRIVCLSSHSLLETFANIVDRKSLEAVTAKTSDRNLSVRNEGGSSSSMMSTFIGEIEWSATGLKEASLATGGAGEKDVRFAILRAISRMTEMGSPSFGGSD